MRINPLGNIPPTPFTPTFRNMGVVNVGDYTWSKVGSLMIIQGWHQLPASGLAAALAELVLPVGVTSDVAYASLRDMVVGQLITATNNAPMYSVLARELQDSVKFGIVGASNALMTRVNGNAFPVSQFQSVNIAVHIQGWA